MAHVVSDESHLSQIYPRNAASHQSDRKCILLIEDDEDAMFLVRCAVEEYGRSAYRLEWAATLNQGLEKLRTGKIDLVLLDLGLPETTGAESYARLRDAAFDAAMDIPVLVLTGDSREQTEMALASTDVKDYLMKDQISGALLMQAIRSALRDSKRNRTSRPASDLPEDSPQSNEITSFVPSPSLSNN